MKLFKRKDKSPEKLNHDAAYLIDVYCLGLNTGLRRTENPNFLAVLGLDDLSYQYYKIGWDKGNTEWELTRSGR